jgi:hypothetical protein
MLAPASVQVVQAQRGTVRVRTITARLRSVVYARGPQPQVGRQSGDDALDSGESGAIVDGGTVDIAKETAAHVLEPLPALDEISAKHADHPRDKHNVIEQLRKYRPPSERQQPGNVVMLAWRNFYLEFKARATVSWAPCMQPRPALAFLSAEQKFCWKAVRAMCASQALPVSRSCLVAADILHPVCCAGASGCGVCSHLAPRRKL